MTGNIPDIRQRLKKLSPLIHCITNPISIQQCANAVLATGGRPIMAEHPKEVREITQTADALMLNLGNITDVRMESMGISAQAANEKRIPILLDAVGVACSNLRRDYACNLIRTAMPAIVKGNYSEINALYHAAYRSSGVDADTQLDVRTLDKVAVHLARTCHTVILASGKVDIVTDGSRLVHIKNGTPQLSGITGTGCMLGALAAAYLSVASDMDAAVTACVVLGVCGQRSETQRGCGTFLMNLMDALSTVCDADLEEYLEVEECSIEEL